jgi:hypothetical protein
LVQYSIGRPTSRPAPERMSPTARAAEGSRPGSGPTLRARTGG